MSKHAVPSMSFMKSMLAPIELKGILPPEVESPAIRQRKKSYEGLVSRLYRLISVVSSNLAIIRSDLSITSSLSSKVFTRGSRTTFLPSGVCICFTFPAYTVPKSRQFLKERYLAIFSPSSFSTRILIDLPFLRPYTLSPSTSPLSVNSPQVSLLRFYQCYKCLVFLLVKSNRHISLSLTSL